MNEPKPEDVNEAASAQSALNVGLAATPCPCCLRTPFFTEWHDGSPAALEHVCELIKYDRACLTTETQTAIEEWNALIERTRQNILAANV